VRAVTSAWSRIWRPLRRAWPDECYAVGKTLVGIEQNDEQVSAVFDDGSRVEGDLLVASRRIAFHGSRAVSSRARATLCRLRGLARRGRGGALSPDFTPDVHRMVFGFPDGELMLSIPMPAPRGEGNAPAISSGSGRSRKAPSPAFAPMQAAAGMASRSRRR
jgi:hypothetical protein